MDELKLCPFCGGAPRLMKTMHGRPVQKWVRCDHCEASASAYHRQEDAIKAWNSRYTAPADVIGGMFRADEMGTLIVFT
jgi:Lar family restriction alleviation protein